MLPHKNPAIGFACLLTGLLLGYHLGNREQKPPNILDDTRPPSQPATERRPISNQASPSVIPDPARTFGEQVKAAYAHNSFRTRQFAVEMLFEEMTPEDAPRILAQIEAWPNWRERRDMLLPFFVRWGEIDSKNAIAHADKAQSRGRLEILSAAYAGWANRDAHAAWQHAQPTLADEDFRRTHRIRLGILVNLTKQDMPAALAVLDSETNPSRWPSIANHLVEGALQQGTAKQLLAQASQLGDLEKQKRLLQTVFARWAENETDTPLQAMTDLADPELAHAAMEGFLHGWAVSDGQSAFYFALDHQENPAVSKNLDRLLSSALSSNDDESTQRTLAHLESLGLTNEYADRIVRTLAHRQPQLALEYLPEIGNDATRNQLAGNVLSQLTARNPQQAIDSFQAFDEASRSRYARHIAQRLTHANDGATQLRRLYELVPQTNERTQSISMLINQIAVRPERAPQPPFLEALFDIANGEAQLSDQDRNRLLDLMDGKYNSTRTERTLFTIPPSR